MKTFLIVNPEAAGGRSLRRWPYLCDQIYQRLGLFEYEFTNASGAATVLARKAVDGGYRRIVAVGGDGTVNEVINGLMDLHGHAVAPDILFGALPAGSGTDYWRSLGLPEQLLPMAERLAVGTPMACDLGRVTLHWGDGRPFVRYFCNMADVGLGGEVVHHARQFPAWSRGRINYALATMKGLWGWRPTIMSITVDGKTLPPEPLLIALVANGPSCGGGMCVAPQATVTSGHFELVRVQPVRWSRALALLPSLYSGRFTSAPEVQTSHAREVIIDAPEPLKVSLDGEVPGQTRATFQICPKALSVIV
ncbi:MAG: diacylglycerol kinase family lipid kinase [Deltaproteobacteria bacterium]|nr:diacylglycerol kinase family lipid kinase [Deltaproteobacteria bacterium]